VAGVTRVSLEIGSVPPDEEGDAVDLADDVDELPSEYLLGHRVGVDQLVPEHPGKIGQVLQCVTGGGDLLLRRVVGW